MAAQFDPNVELFISIDFGMKLHPVAGREDVPKLGMRNRERHSHILRLGIPDTDIHDLAHLLSLRSFVEEQQLLAFGHGYVQHQKSPVHAHVDRAGIFIE